MQVAGFRADRTVAIRNRKDFRRYDFEPNTPAMTTTNVCSHVYLEACERSRPRAGGLLAGRDLLARRARGFLGVERELVGHVVLEDVAHVGRGLRADAPRDDDFDVVEPLVRIEPALGGLAAHAGDGP